MFKSRFMFRPRLNFSPRLMLVPEGAEGGAGESADTGVAQETGTEVVSQGEEATTNPEEQRDRDEVRQMSSFLRDFQAKQQAEPQEPEGETPEDNPSAEDSEIPAEKSTEEQAQEQEAKPGAVEESDAPQVFKVGDKEYTPEQIAEMEKGFMMQKDYTVKTQSLAEERRQLEAQKAEYDKALKLAQDIERDPIGTLQKLQEQYEQEGIYEPKDPAQLALEDQRRELEAKESAIKQKEQEIEHKQVFNDMENRVTKLAEQYGDEFDREKTIQFMIDNQIYSPETAWKAIRHDLVEEKSQKEVERLKAELKEAKKTAVNEYVKTKTTKKSAPLPVGAGTNTGSPPIAVKKPKTFEDARKAAMSRQWS